MGKDQYHHGDLKNALIKAGAEIVLEEGIGSLSLRRVSSRVGVTHTAAYSHFYDKQALLAAISVEGFRQLYDRLEATVEAHQDKPSELLLEVAYAYVQFAQESPAFFKLVFSGVLKNGASHPEYVELTRRNFQLLVNLVKSCQDSGALPQGDPEEIAISKWSLVHGFAALLIENQFSHTLLEKSSLKEILATTLRWGNGK